MSQRWSRPVSFSVLGCALVASALAAAQPAPPSLPAPPSVEPSAPKPEAQTPPFDPDLVRRMEKRIADLEARVNAAEKKPEPAPEKKPEEKPKAAEPFAFADFSWVPGNYGSSEKPLSWGPFTGELRVDTVYHYSFNRPKDNTISGSSEVFRHDEFQVTQLGIGGDFNYKNVQARLMTQFGMYSQTTPRNDASPGRGQWNLHDAYRFISEAYAGYHFDVLNGINIQAGIFMSLCRFVELLQLRQLDVSAVVRVIEHAVVLQRRAGSDSLRATS